nr:RibD C-terminal domain protein [uncultured bacterium]
MKVFMIAAMSADGYIGRDSNHLADWTGNEDKKVFVRLTKAAGVMVMGARTFGTIGRALPGRRTIVYTRHPESIRAEGIEATAEPPAELLERLKREGANGVAICGGAATYDLFLQAGLIEEIYLTVEPVLFGSGVRLFNNPIEVPLKLLETTALSDNVLLLHYHVASV